MPKKTTVDYDEENDDLFISRSRGNYEGSVEIGDFIVDFSKDDKITGIEIMNASKNLSVSKSLLAKIKSASMGVSERNHAMVVSALLVLENNREIRAAIPIPVCS